jgi:hypothetical protein
MKAANGCKEKALQYFSSEGAIVFFSPKDFVFEAGRCPFVDLPCAGGPLQSLECRRRAMRDFDPAHRLGDFELIYCALSQQAMAHAKAKLDRFGRAPEPLTN